MLRGLLKNVFAARSAPAVRGPDSAGVAQEVSRRFEAAAADWRAGRALEAAGACKALLEIAPDYWSAHNLLASIELPGESYFQVLARVHAHLRPRMYLEIGVARGESIRLAGPETRAIGVDPEPGVAFPLGPNISIVAQTSDEFFAGRDVRAELDGLPVDLAFIDGMHHFEFALRDFMNIEALCAPSSTILVHDVYPLDERTAARERVTEFWSGDIWRLVLLLRKHRPDLIVRTVAAAPTGLAVVRNLDPKSTYIRDHLDALVAEYLAVDFSTLASGKAEQLALVPSDWSQVRALLDARVSERTAAAPGRPTVLNVGGSTKTIPIPPHYAGWVHLLLDIDPRRGADVVCDARELRGLAAAQFDAVYCSHNLEHYYRHDVPKVLAGFLHVLKDVGFAEIRVPDMPAVFRKMLDDGLDLEDALYQAPVGPIRVIDVIYGWGPEIEKSGNDFFAHKTGFSQKSLCEALLAAGFAEVWNAPPFAPYELRAIAFKDASTPGQHGLLGISLDPSSAGG